jgi:peptide/nickel transport system permease protein
VKALIAKRLAFAVPMLFIVSFFSFVLVTLSPTDPARIVAGPYADEARIAQVRTELGLNRSVVSQYASWVGKAVRGDFGKSLTIAQGVPVRSMLNDRIPSTFSTVAASLVVVTVVGLALGVFSAVRGGSSGRFVSVFSLLGLAVPGFWLVLILTRWFSVRWQIFPAIGYRNITESPWKWFVSLVLPVVSISVGPIASLTKQTRDSFLDAIGKDFVRVMQANGLPRRSVLYRHALKNAAIPLSVIMGVAGS